MPTDRSTIMASPDDRSKQERTPLIRGNAEADADDKNEDDDDDDFDAFDYDDVDGAALFGALKEVDLDRSRGSMLARRESIAADRLSMRLLSVPDDDEEQLDQILQETLHMDGVTLISSSKSLRESMAAAEMARRKSTVRAGSRFCSMTGLCVLAFGLIIGALWIGAEFIGPPNQPVGPYALVERQVRIMHAVLVWTTFLVPDHDLLCSKPFPHHAVPYQTCRRGMSSSVTTHSMKDQIR